MTRPEFFEKLTRHDWHYHFSDDHRYYVSGQTREAELKAEAATDPVKQKMFDDYAAFVTSGPSWDKPQLPKPQLADYGEDDNG